MKWTIFSIYGYDLFMFKVSQMLTVLLNCYLSHFNVQVI